MANLVAIIRSANQVMFEVQSLCVVKLIVPVHAAVALFTVYQAVWVVGVHAMVSVTVTHLLCEVPTELFLLMGIRH